jgi:hypothetical protein
MSLKYLHRFAVALQEITPRSTKTCHPEERFNKPFTVYFFAKKPTSSAILFHLRNKAYPLPA